MLGTQWAWRSLVGASAALALILSLVGAFPASANQIWTPQTSGTSNILRGVAEDGSGNWVVVGYSGTILTSSDDGTTWTSRSTGTSYLYGVAGDGSGN